MSYAIIGFGEIGKTLAKAFARKGIAVSVATTHDPESFASAAAAAAIGPGITPTTLAEAARADVVFLAVRFQSHPDVAKALPNWQGKIIVDPASAGDKYPQGPFLFPAIWNSWSPGMISVDGRN